MRAARWLLVLTVLVGCTPTTTAPVSADAPPMAETVASRPTPKAPSTATPILDGEVEREEEHIAASDLLK